MSNTSCPRYGVVGHACAWFTTDPERLRQGAGRDLPTRNVVVRKRDGVTVRLGGKPSQSR
jgi:hypothetical protein